MSQKVLTFRSNKAANDANAVRKLYREGEQLPLNFDDSKLAVVVSTDKMSGYEFMELIHELNPKLVIDMRSFRSFDFDGTGPYGPRRALADAGARYVRTSVDPAEFSSGILKSEAIQRACRSVLLENADSPGRQTGPWLVLTHQFRHSQILARYLEAELRRNSNPAWDVECLFPS